MTSLFNNNLRWLVFTFFVLVSLSSGYGVAATFQTTKESNLQIQAPGSASVTGEVLEVLGNKFAVLSDYPEPSRLYVISPLTGKTTIVSTAFSNPKYLKYYSGFVFFCATDSAGDEELWRLHFNTLEIVKIDLNSSASSSPNQLFEFKGDLYFTAVHEEYGRELWKLRKNPDGNEAQVVKDITDGGSSGLSNFLVSGEMFYFVGPGITTPKTRLWASDGTDENTYVVNGQVQDGLYDSSSSKPFIIQDSIHFYRHRYTWTSSITKLYKVVGGASGASAQYVTTLISGSTGTYNAIPSGDSLYFLWATSQKHLLFYDITTATQTRLSTGVSEWELINDTLYFVSNGGLFKAHRESFEAVSAGVTVKSLRESQGVLYMLNNSGELLYTTPDTNIVLPVNTSGLSNIKNLQGKTSELYLSAVMNGSTDLFSVSRPAYQSAQTRYASCGDLNTVTDIADNAILLSHGWNSNMNVWASETANKICEEIGGSYPSSTAYLLQSDSVFRHCHTPDWDVYLIDWRSKAGVFDGVVLPRWAYRNAVAVGRQIGACLKDKQYKHVHLLGHSAGSNLIDNIKMVLKANVPQPTIHMTFFDAYDPYSQLSFSYSNGSYHIDNMQISNYGTGADWADNYLDIRELEHFFRDNFDRTKTFMPNAFNIDVTRYDSGLNAPFVGKHGWPYEFYKDHTINPISIDVASYPIGFQVAKEKTGSFPPDDRPKGKGCKLPEEDGDLFSKACETLFQVPSYYERESLDEMTTGGSNSWITVSSNSVTGNVDFNNQNSIWSGSTYLGMSTNSIVPQSKAMLSSFVNVQATGEAVWVSFELDIDIATDTLEFDYEFVNSASAQGLLTAFVDNNVVWQADERYYDVSVARGTNNYNSGSIFVGELEPGKHTLSFRVDKFSESDSTVYIMNLKLGKVIEDQTQAKFPWPTFLPAIIGGQK